MLAQRRGLSEIAEEIIGRGTIDADQVKYIRLEVFSEARVIERMLDDGVVDRREAELLFSINDALEEGLYDLSWRDLFVEAITSHVLRDEMSPGHLDEEEAQFIMAKVQRRGSLNSVEVELLACISACVLNAPAFFHEFVLASLKDYVLRDRIVDERDARLIENVIFGPGSSSGKAIDERERAWLGGIDGLTLREKNHPSWTMLKHRSGLAG